MSKPLKPCPFCGGEAIVSERENGAQFVECKRCGCCTSCFLSLKDSGAAQAVIGWNNRRTPDLTEALARLKEASK